MACRWQLVDIDTHIDRLRGLAIGGAQLHPRLIGLGCPAQGAIGRFDLERFAGGRIAQERAIFELGAAGKQARCRHLPVATRRTDKNFHWHRVVLAIDRKTNRPFIQAIGKGWATPRQRRDGDGRLHVIIHIERRGANLHITH